MKKIYTLGIALSTMAVIANAQIPQSAYLDINNVKVPVNSSGELFWDYVNNTGMEVPIGSGKSTIGAGNLWIGGLDAGGQLKIAAQTYRQNGNDFFFGPLNSSAIYDTANNSTMNRVWKINQSDIDAYSNWINNPIGPNPVNATAMEVINHWPAFNIDGSSLAPFIDSDANGLYDPGMGDYPKIKGDQAIFFVYNDKANMHTETGGQAIGLEIQGMAYAYACPDDSALYNTIFTNYKIINKSAFRLDSAFIGNWTDIDIGGGFGDYIGSDVTRGAYYGYNTVNPAVQAVVFLNGPFADPDGIDNPTSSTPNGTNYGDGIADNEQLGMGRFMYYNNDFTITGNPTLAIQYYQYLITTWKDGTPLTYGGDGHLTGASCNYAFPGASDPSGFGTSSLMPDWDATGTPASDKRGIGTYGPFTILPGSVIGLDFAYVYARSASGGNASIALMQNRIDSIRSKFFNASTLLNCGSSTGIKNLNNNPVIAFYPNPATTFITIDFKTTSKNYSIKIYDAIGRMVKNIEHISPVTTIINIEDLNSGIYLLNVFDGKDSVTQRFIKQ